MAQWIVVTVVDDPTEMPETRWAWHRPLPDGLVEDAPAMRQFLGQVGTMAAKAYEPAGREGESQVP